MSMLRRRLMQEEHYRYIHFQDPEAERLCTGWWDKDGDGKLSPAEAAAVTAIDKKKTWPGVKTLDELRYFTGASKLWIAGADALERITFPTKVTTLTNESFGVPVMPRPDTNPLVVTLLADFKYFGYHGLGYGTGGRAPFVLILPNTTAVPAIHNYPWFRGPVCLGMYVRDELVEVFKESNLKKYKILPLSECPYII